MEREVFSYVLKGTEEELDEMDYLMNFEKLCDNEFDKYFYQWYREGLGMFYFPKENYFVSRDGETNYAIALLRYGGNVGESVY